MNKDERKVSEDLGLVILKYMEEQDLTYKELSERTKISESYLWRLANSEKLAPSFKVIESICQGLGIEVGIMLSILEKDEQRDSTKTFDFIIMTNDFTLNGKKITRNKKEEIVELIEFIFDSKSNINSETKSTFEDIYRLLRLAVDIKND